MAGKIRYGIILLLLLSAFFCVPAVAAQEPVFRLDMDQLNLQKGVSCNVVVSLVNAQNAQIISIDGLENFDILSQSQSNSTSIVNNVATYQVDTYYTIMPKAAGQYILKANINYNNQTYETNSLQVTVTENANESSSAPDLFVKTVLSHDEAYLGEKIVVTYELYSRYNIDSFGLTDYSAIDGVIMKDTPNDRLKAEYVYVDGNRYEMHEVRQFIIDPLRPGACTIPSFNLQVNVITESGIGGGFGGLFRSSTPMYLQTEAKELLVKELPLEGRPNNFSGIVGELQLNGSYSRNEVDYGDSLVLTIEASGNCNLDGIKNIAGSSIPGFTVYETQKDIVESVENNKYHALKVFETILIPEKTGALDITPASVSYFNPVTGKYEAAKIPEATINVLGEIPIPNINDGNVNYGNQFGGVQTVFINQVNYADAFDGYFTIQIQKELFYSILIGFIIFLVLTACLLWLLLHRKKQNPELKSLYRQLMGAKDINEIYNLFNAMVKHCYNVNLKASSKNFIQSSLRDADLSAQVTDIMDFMESVEARDEKGTVKLKDKIKNIYNSKLCKVKTGNSFNN